MYTIPGVKCHEACCNLIRHTALLLTCNHLSLHRQKGQYTFSDKLVITSKVMIAGYTLVVKAPIELYNALPMPLTVALSSTDPDRSSLPERMLVQPLQSLLLHQMGAFHHLDKVALEPSGYCLSSAMGLPHGPSPRNGCASTSSCIPVLAHLCLSVYQSHEAAISGASG